MFTFHGFLLFYADKQEKRDMRKVTKAIIALLLIPTLLWIGTRNLSDTQGNVFVERAETCTKPNNDFSHSSNPSIGREACHDYPADGDFHPLTCINTATSFYDSQNTCSYCPDFVRMPEQWGFREVAARERKPGDLIIFYRNGTASHAAMYIGESLLGPLMDHSDGGYRTRSYQRHVPYAPLLRLFWEKARYFRCEKIIATNQNNVL